MGKIMLSPKTEGLVNNALMYAGLGWKVFPVHTMLGGVCSCHEGAACGRPAKHPRIAESFEGASNDPTQIKNWWTQWPQANIGIATGEASGLTVVDADAGKGKAGVINLTQLCSDKGGVPATLTSDTGGGGLHLYFTYCKELQTGTDVLAKSVDVRNDGGYVIAPPSNHYTGSVYKWRANTNTLLPVPAYMLERETTDATKKKRGRPRQHAAMKIEKVESMLKAITPDDRDRWLKVGVILGRMFVGTPFENDAWAIYETWSARDSKFDEDRAGNIARMREMFSERSQEAPRAGGVQLTIGSIITWAREGDWTPFGDRVGVEFELGNDYAMSEALCDVLVVNKNNYHFNVGGSIRDVLRAPISSLRYLKRASITGDNPPETLMVRETTPAGMHAALSKHAALTTRDKHGAPTAMPIPIQLASMSLVSLSHKFPTLTGIAEWPMVGEDGVLIMKSNGYDAATGLYFNIDPKVKIDVTMSAEAGWAAIRDELLCDFPFESELHKAGALAMMLTMMQRPLMKTAPAFAAVAPQPGTGKSTLIEVASIAVHGFPIASHPLSGNEEELRKAIMSMLVAKIPAVMFDNIGKGSAIGSNLLAKLITGEESTDRVLGRTETRSEVNSLTMTFTGNSISFVKDMATRVAVIELNAKLADPLRRQFKHRDIKVWAYERRSRWLSALVAIAKSGHNDTPMVGGVSRFEDFNEYIAKPIYMVSKLDVRELLDSGNEDDAEELSDVKQALLVLWKFQQLWRQTANTYPWTVGEAFEAIGSGAIDDASADRLKRACGDVRYWDSNPKHALGNLVKRLRGNYSYAPYVLSGTMDSHTQTMKWRISGGPDLGTPTNSAGTF